MTTERDPQRDVTQAPQVGAGPGARPRWRYIGPGLVAAATGVGAGDLVASLVAGSKYGYTLLWAVILGVIVKLAIGEAVGRWHLASGGTLLQGFASLGRWTAWYFGPYAIVFGFVYGGAIMSATALPLNAMFPVLSVTSWAVLAGLVGLVMVLIGGYFWFERVMTVLVGVMFVTMVSCAILLTPDVPQMLAGLAPVMPGGSLLYTLGLVGGVGGTITIASYGWWVTAKGWEGRGWLSVMRLDNAVGYVLTGIFVLSTLVVGAELLYVIGQDVAESEEGLLAVTGPLEDRFGPVVRVLFLIGFWAASMTSLIGAWNGVSLLFSDFLRRLRGRPDLHGEAVTKTLEFRAFVVWMAIPPMLLLLFEEPFLLVVIYAALGAMFLPFLAVTLLLLLNSDRVEPVDRSGWLSNTVLAGAAGLFAVLFAYELTGLFGG
ncbi:MAG: Nramp family divalent metal transporter [Carbonactinosporaceae bacterium]